jgi:hypothetical protein
VCRKTKAVRLAVIVLKREPQNATRTSAWRSTHRRKTACPMQTKEEDEVSQTCFVWV